MISLKEQKRDKLKVSVTTRSKAFVWPELIGEFEAKKEPIKAFCYVVQIPLNLAFNTIGIISYLTFTLLHRIIPSPL